MTERCFFKTCDSYKSADPSISYHLFPKDPEIRKKWVEFFVKDFPSFPSNDNIKLCSAHFKQTDFVMVRVMDNQRKWKIDRALKSSAVPSLRNGVAQKFVTAKSYHQQSVNYVDETETYDDVYVHNNRNIILQEIDILPSEDEDSEEPTIFIEETEPDNEYDDLIVEEEYLEPDSMREYHQEIENLRKRNTDLEAAVDILAADKDNLSSENKRLRKINENLIDQMRDIRDILYEQSKCQKC